MIQKICDLLDAQGYTQQDFEGLTRLAKNRISKWKDKKGEPTARQIHRIARQLGVSIDYLVDDSQDEPVAEFTPDEVFLVRTFRSLGLEIDAAVRRLHAVPTVKPLGTSYGDIEDAKLKKMRKKNGA